MNNENNDREKSKSKSKNSPFNGKKFKGKVLAVYNNKSLSVAG